MASSDSIPSPKAALSRSTTLSQFFISTGVFSLLSYISSLPIPLCTVIVPSVAANFTSDANHPFKCLARIPESPPEQWLHSCFTAYSIFSSVGTKFSTVYVSPDKGLFSPRGGTRLRSTACCSQIGLPSSRLR